MFQYPSISSIIETSHVHVFDKIDGSNLRFEWTKKKGITKFGTRHRLFGIDEQPYCRAIPEFNSKYSESLNKIFKDNNWQKVIIFFEFHGPSSCFGTHDLNEKQTITLIDIRIEKFGILPPKDFFKLFSHLDIPNILHVGFLDQDIITKIKNGTLSGMGNEGVVCKGAFDRTLGGPLMFKIKRNDWLDRLKNHCGNNIELFENLK